MTFEVDTSQLRQLGIQIGEALRGSYDEVDAIVKKGADNIKKEMQRDASASAHFKGLAGSITYEHENSRDEVARVIGPDKSRRGGALGNIAYFGTSRGGGTLDIDKPLSNEAPRMESALRNLLGEIGDSL